MKKRVITILLVSSILFSGCSKEEVSSVNEPQEPPIYVERDDLLYSDGETEQTSDSNTSTEDTPSEGKPTETTPSNEGGSGGGSPSATNPSGGGTNHPAPTDENDPDEVYNTTVKPNLEDTEATFGKIQITHFSEIINEEERSGIGREFELGDNSYGFYRDNLLATNGATFIDDPFKVSIKQSEECPYAFDFVGAGHYLKKANAEQGSNFWLEVEKDGSVLTHTAIKKITPAGGYSIAVKGIAVKLGEFDRVTANGDADYFPEVTLSFLANVHGSEKNIKVGMTYQSLVDLLGEGTEITGEIVIDEETGETEEVTYFVYKTTDFTLIVEKTYYPDIKPDPLYVQEEGVSEDTVLISTIFLIKNEAELPPIPEED